MYVAVVLGSVSFTKGLLLSLRASDLLTTAIVALYAVALLAVIHRVIFNPRLHDAVAFFALVGLTAVVAAMITGLEIPEERVHFLQYGLMAGLAAAALRGHLPPGKAYIGGLLITSGIGWVDELLQAILPYRYYDLRDVALNGQAALLGTIADEILHDRLGWRQKLRRH